MSKPDPTADLNATITSAVNARVEAQVLAALTDSEVFAAMVTAALQQPIEVRGGLYDKTKTTYLAHVLQQTIQARTKEVVTEAIEEHADKIREEVRKALRKSIGVIADSLVDGFVADSSGRYPSIKVTFGGE